MFYSWEIRSNSQKKNWPDRSKTQSAVWEAPILSELHTDGQFLYFLMAPLCPAVTCDIISYMSLTAMHLHGNQPIAEGCIVFCTYRKYHKIGNPCAQRNHLNLGWPLNRFRQTFLQAKCLLALYPSFEISRENIYLLFI